MPNHFTSFTVARAQRAGLDLDGPKFDPGNNGHPQGVRPARSITSEHNCITAGPPRPLRRGAQHIFSPSGSGCAARWASNRASLAKFRNRSFKAFRLAISPISDLTIRPGPGVAPACAAFLPTTTWYLTSENF